MAQSTIPTPYRLFFLYAEPLATLSGAIVALISPGSYLTLTHSASTPSSFFSRTPQIPQVVEIVVHQVGNLYLLLALNEALVLRATPDVKVWRMFMIGMLLADFGHLWSVSGISGEGGGLGPASAMKWNAMGWGNVAFVYVAALVRIAFLAGLGLTKPTIERGRKSR